MNLTDIRLPRLSPQCEGARLCALTLKIGGHRGLISEASFPERPGVQECPASLKSAQTGDLGVEKRCRIPPAGGLGVFPIFLSPPILPKKEGDAVVDNKDAK